MARLGCNDCRFLGLSLFLVLCTTARAASYGEQCSQDTECKQKSAPHCNIFFEDKSYDFNEIDYYQTYTTETFRTALEKVDKVRKYQGVCVECFDTCDCGLDEYCGYDYEDKYDEATSEWTFEHKVTVPAGITSLNKGGGMPPNVKKELEMFAKQYEGLPIRSKCKKYSTSHMKGNPKVCSPSADIQRNAFAKMVEESRMPFQPLNPFSETCAFQDDDDQQRQVVTRIPHTWPKDAQDRFCGRIVSWGNAFHEVKYLPAETDFDGLAIKSSEWLTSARRSTGNNFEAPVRCVPEVVSKDKITCPSCLHDGGCGSPRKDEAVCCKNARFSVWNEKDGMSDYSASWQSVRSCHDSSGRSVWSRGYEAYKTCEEACSRRGSYYNIIYYPDCKNPADGTKTPLMTDNPTSNYDANYKKWCECVETCIRCTAANGGTGERPTTDTRYRKAHGTCAPPPVSWSLPTTAAPAAPAGTPAPTPVEAVDFMCDAPAAPETCDAVRVRPTHTACKPSCVQCLVDAMQYECDSDSQSQCPTTTESLWLWPECNAGVLTEDFLSQVTCKWIGSQYICQAPIGNFEKDSEFYRLLVHSPAVEWAGSCLQGSCNVCTEGDEMSCGDDRPRRYCVDAQWTYQQWHGAEKKAEIFLIAACTLLGCCFLALLGVIAAVMMLKKREGAGGDIVYLSTARNDIEQATLSITERQTPTIPPRTPLSIVSPVTGTCGEAPLEGRARMSREQALAALKLPSNATDEDIKQAVANYEKRLRSFRSRSSATVAQASAVSARAAAAPENTIEEADLEEALQLSLAEMHSVSHGGLVWDASQYNIVPR